ncbi:DUF1995 domain containing protein [Nitzschia inconspicua]|uniref:DUF1995 domain containing protein n=1 Tax=Nitzschia inconspicua TaxID=303405 RepID=A0A9K3KYC7_9STRA|nr:DUF1995 domain containing protein [Nitzschia inconspicua]
MPISRIRLCIVSAILLSTTILHSSTGSVVAFVPVDQCRKTSETIHFGRDHDKYRASGIIPLSISFGSGNQAKSSTATLPRDVKEAVSNCRQATQQALQNRLSRMDIEFPVGTKFGVEKTPTATKTKKSASDTLGDGGPTQAILDRSNRELARLFVEMFQPVGGENIVVAFVEEELADAAKQKWKGDAGASSRILAMNRSKAKKKAAKKTTKAKGFAAKLAAEVGDDNEDKPSGPFQLPPKTEVALFVAPGPKELVVIDKICQEVVGR